MSRRKILWIALGLTGLLAVIIILVTANFNNQPTEEAVSFCDAYPNAVFCLDDNPTDLEIASDMLETLMVRYPSGMDETFCKNYFDGNLSDYCLEDPRIIFPTDFGIVSDQYEIIQIREGIFDIRTHYSTFVPAYAIRMALNNLDGAYHISGFSFYDIPEATDFGLTEEEINSFMVDMITDSDSGDAIYCSTYFTWIARNICELDQDAYITNPDVIENYVIEEIGTNRYEYSVTNNDASVELMYTILFEDEDGTYKISELSIQVIE